MREFIKVLRRFVPPYKKYLFMTVLFNILTALLNIFSFSLIIPILQILFKLDNSVYVYMEYSDDVSLKDWAINNFYYFVTGLITDHGPSLTLLLLGVFLIVMTFMKTGCYYFSSACLVPMRTGIVRDMRVTLFDKILSLPLSFFSNERKGDIVARISGDVQEVENSIMSSLDMLFKNPILIISYFATLIAISWQLTLFTLVVLPFMGWIMGKVGRQLKRSSLEAQGRWSDIMSEVDETLGGLRVIMAFNAQQKIKDRFVATNNSYRSIIGRVAMRQQLAHPVSEFLGTVLIVAVLWFGGTLILNETSMVDASSFIFYLVILYSLINPLKEFTKAGYNIPKGLASMERVDAILKAENNLTEKENPVKLDGFNDRIEFHDVSFSYDTRPVLEGINLTIRKGQTIALVGQSGSGKSTLVDLIPRFRDVNIGSVTIDGVDVRDVALRDLRALMGNVNQEAILFNDTFYNNITFGVGSATMEEVVAAAKIANAHEFIMETEHGYQTYIGDRGGKLSGGQRQRISIARAILKNPPILILDEATSALDTESERMVQDALEKLMKSRTTIAIAHRLSTIRNADEICVLHEGRIVERGKHEELIALNGYYKKLCDMQSF
ncbi:MAG TPA: ABC transporter ATP-binding protein [Candidatus Avibacteroides faecavium]|nr:ABC transporter ATP-binding protein [Candidatus Avibacteroides faecavium]